jgi:hypothetical protein
MENHVSLGNHPIRETKEPVRFTVEFLEVPNPKGDTQSRIDGRSLLVRFLVRQAVDEMTAMSKRVA